MERGTSTLLAGVAAAIALPGSVLLLGLPLWLGAVIAAGIFFGLHLALRPSGLGLKLDDFAEAQTQTVRSLLAEGEAALARLDAAGKLIKDGSMRAAVATLCSTAAGILAHIKAEPARVMAVRRLLTFYLPNAAALAEGWQTLEGNTDPSPGRMTQTREVVNALKDAFVKFENQADAPELQALDLNLKLVKDSLKADLEKTA